MLEKHECREKNVEPLNECTCEEDGEQNCKKVWYCCDCKREMTVTCLHGVEIVGVGLSRICEFG